MGIPVFMDFLLYLLTDLPFLWICMKPSTELFKLIKSLTKSEKRFFKLSSSLQSGEKNYLKIFDFIERQSSYDEEELKKTYEGETFIKHLPSEKNHLYKTADFLMYLI